MEERLPLVETPRRAHLDRRTVEVGRRGVLEARAALRRSREAAVARRQGEAA
jgi:hypothetical protein